MPRLQVERVDAMTRRVRQLYQTVGIETMEPTSQVWCCEIAVMVDYVAVVILSDVV